MPKAKDVIAYAQDKKAVMVDLKFMDFLGLWQHFTIPLAELTEAVFDEGLGFDGSSIRGWMPIHASDMLVVPDTETGTMDPFMKDATLSLICNIVDPITKEPYLRDPRFIAQKAEKYLKASGVGDVAYFGPEAEFFIFDGVSYDTGPNHGHYKVESREGQWETGSPVEHVFDGKQYGTRPNLGYKPRYKEGYFPVPPIDSLQDLRTEMCRVMEQVGIQVERQHHEVATAGQAEIDIRFDSLTKTADKLLWFKYIVKNVALRNGKTVTFMPKPLYGDNGSGMHTHQSVWKAGKPLFAGEGYSGLSKTGLHYIGGLLKHARALAAICNPTTNSYKRLVPGFEAPVNLAYSSRNRSAAIRIPTYSPSPPPARSVLQPVPGVLGDADGRPGRRREPHRSGRATRQGHLRPEPGGAEGRSEDAGFPRGGPGRAEEGPRVPAQGRRVHRGRDRGLDREQGGARAEPGAAAADADRVRPLLRHLAPGGRRIALLQAGRRGRRGGVLPGRGREEEAVRWIQ